MDTIRVDGTWADVAKVVAEAASGSLREHKSHDQKSHGNWAGGSSTSPGPGGGKVPKGRKQFTVKGKTKAIIKVRGGKYASVEKGKDGKWRVTGRGMDRSTALANLRRRKGVPGRGAGATKPAAKPTKPAAKPTKPAAKPTKPAAKPAAKPATSGSAVVAKAFAGNGWSAKTSVGPNGEETTGTFRDGKMTLSVTQNHKYGYARVRMDWARGGGQRNAGIDSPIDPKVAAGLTPTSAAKVVRAEIRRSMKRGAGGVSGPARKALDEFLAKSSRPAAKSSRPAAKPTKPAPKGARPQAGANGALNRARPGTRPPKTAPSAREKPKNAYTAPKPPIPRPRRAPAAPSSSRPVGLDSAKAWGSSRSVTSGNHTISMGKSSAPGMTRITVQTKGGGKVSKTVPDAKAQSWSPRQAMDFMTRDRSGKRQKSAMYQDMWRMFGG